MKQLIILLICILLVPCVYPQETLKEEVSVKWWVLPLFAVDGKDNPVLDLKAADFDVYLDNQRIENFTLYRREFNVLEKKSEIRHKKEKEKPVLIKKDRMTFLIIDRLMTDSKSIRKAKALARDIISSAAVDMQFVLMTIEPGTGLKYVTGPSRNKNKLIRQVKGVREKVNRRLYWDWEVVAPAKKVFAVKGARPVVVRRVESEGMVYIGRLVSKLLKMKSKPFFNSFALFYKNIQTIEAHKFVYLLTEGVPRFQEITEKGSTYKNYLNEMARYLGRCGTVLFIVNPAPTATAIAGTWLPGGNLPFYLYSGTRSLEFFAQQSGGKYIHSPRDLVSEKINDFHRAYYEVAFDDLPGFTGDIHEIRVMPKRSGLKLHTINTVEKRKQYAQMEDIEKELLALNLASDNPLYRSPLKKRELEILNMEDRQPGAPLKIKLPGDFEKKNLDVFKVRLQGKEGNAQVEKEWRWAKSGTLDIDLKNSEQGNTYIIVVDKDSNTALVQGFIDPGSLKARVLAKEAKEFTRIAVRMTQAELQEMEEILDGAAGYCEKLNRGAFHYICMENVTENLDAFRFDRVENQESYSGRTPTYVQGLRKREGNLKLMKHKLINKYTNDYQVISLKGEAREQRKLVEGKIDKDMDGTRPVRLDAFVSQNIVFLPISIFALENRDRFQFRLVKYENIKGVRTALLECFPGDGARVKSIFGRLWVDLSDFSIARMEVNPVSIGGYEKMLEQAMKMGSALHLSCRIDFGKKRQGLRFPTRVLIKETYSGGSRVRAISGKPTWERSKTTYIFDNFRFFEVATRVTEKE